MDNSESENIWDLLQLTAKPTRTRTIDYARLLGLIDVPLNKRSFIKIGGMQYTPINFFHTRKPESLKRKINRWKRNGKKLNLNTLFIELARSKFISGKIGLNIIEIPTNRSEVRPIFFTTGTTFFLLLLSKDSEIKNIFDADSFQWKTFNCVVIRLSEKKFWSVFGSWAHKAMTDPSLDLDHGLFEFTLLDGMNLLDITVKSWRTKNKKLYYNTLRSFIVAFGQFLENHTLNGI